MSWLVQENKIIMELKCILLVLLLTCSAVKSEVFTALVELEKLYNIESAIITNLDKYISLQEEKLTSLKRFQENFKAYHDLASENLEEFVGNPINSYLLLKRLTSDWANIWDLVRSNNGVELITELPKLQPGFPLWEDLKGAAVALARLQDTYKLETKSIANGELNGKKYSASFTAHDCYELGRQNFINNDFYHSILWMKEANERYPDVSNGTIQKEDILEYLAFASFQKGNVPLALNISQEILKLNPNHYRALRNKGYFAQLVQHPDVQKRKEPLDLSFIDSHKPNLWTQDKENYAALCRGAVSYTEEKRAELKCYYENHNDPYLKIGPFKVELAFSDPDIFIYYDVIHDNEINTVKSIASPKLFRAMVQNSITGESELAPYRISKSAWIPHEEHLHIENIFRRVNRMTRFDRRGYEHLQVANYGIGGHYEPHFDFSQKEEKNAFKSLNLGNRIATVLFYMSDVKEGGATVFPSINAAVWPKKGSAVFWYNLFPSGEGIKNTRHAACPVLVGSKWVSNLWIHENFQEFVRPCGLEPAPEFLTA